MRGHLLYDIKELQMIRINRMYDFYVHKNDYPWKLYYDRGFEYCWCTYDSSLHSHLTRQRTTFIKENMLLFFKKYTIKWRDFSYKHKVYS